MKRTLEDDSECTVEKKIEHEWHTHPAAEDFIELQGEEEKLFWEFVKQANRAAANRDKYVKEDYEECQSGRNRNEQAEQEKAHLSSE